VLDIKVDGLEGLQRELKDFSERRLRAAVATALTRTAVKVRDEVRKELPSVFDRPSPHTVRNLRYLGASAKNLQAVVGFDIEATTDISGRVQSYSDAGRGNTPAGKYLQFQVDGGQRRIKRFELALQAKGAMPRGWVSVPGEGARMDAYGNISRGQIAQIIAQLGTELLSGYTNTPQSINARILGQRKAGGQFLAVLPGGRTRLKPGVYQREFIGRNITPVLIYVKSADYKPRFDFYGIAQRKVDLILPVELEQAVRDSAARLAARGAGV
jgi:hypothetical protein